jgi:beta-lactamase class D
VRRQDRTCFDVQAPHALVALETGVVSDARARVKWDGTKRAFQVWDQDHSLDSAMKNSVVWFFQRTAAAIGRAQCSSR